MSPGEQFGLMSVRELWEGEVAGEPSGNDLEVSPSTAVFKITASVSRVSIQIKLHHIKSRKCGK